MALDLSQLSPVPISLSSSNNILQVTLPDSAISTIVQVNLTQQLPTILSANTIFVAPSGLTIM